MEDLGDDWPAYATGNVRHMHALGVISVNYNLFENSLYGLFAFPLLRAGILHADSSQLFRRLSNEQRIDFIRRGFTHGEPEDAVKDRIGHLIKYWGACFENRNHLMHSRIRYRPMNERLADALLEKPERISFQKPSKGDWAKLLHMTLDLARLRQLADEMHAGWDFSTDLHLYLLFRDYPQPGDKPRTLPDKPPLPDPLEALPLEDPKASPPQPQS